MSKKLVKFNPRSLYDKFCEGDSLTDEEVLSGLFYFRKLSEDLVCLGPTFRLVANEAFRVWNRLFDMATARKLEMGFEPNGDPRPIKEEISWKNTLNSDFLPNLGFWWNVFTEKANLLGYPYYVWNGRVYETKTHKDTELLASDLK